MRSTESWISKVTDKDGREQCIWDLCFNPDGSQLLVCAGNLVLVYDASDGSLKKHLKGHKETVYCVAYAHDGKRFSSGSADKCVIIWSSTTLEGVLKYTHADSIQCVAYNPVTVLLASCACTDFGLWLPDQKAVNKTRVAARVTSCSWTKDGQYLALALYNGVISIRNKNAEEKQKIERPGGALCPVWSISWSPTKDGQEDLLAVADWTQKLSFYQLSGKQVGKDRQLTFDPCCVDWFPKGDFLSVTGSDKQCSLYTREGVRLSSVSEEKSWVWCARVKPNSNHVAIGCQDGTVKMMEQHFSTVHSLYRNRYAYRDGMTDVIVQHLVTEQKARIKCRDLVNKVAVYTNRLAVQLPDRILIYEHFSEETNDMHYKLKDKLNKKLDCNLLVVAAQHLVLCIDRKLQSINFQGIREREWVLESPIRYIRLIGGPPGREGLLVGMTNGQVTKIFLDNGFPIQLLKQPTSLKCLDLSVNRDKLGIIDEHNTLSVYSLINKELLFQEPNAESLAWSTTHNDMICFSGRDTLHIKTGNFPTHHQKMQGIVVGFTGTKIFCLNTHAVTTIDVHQSAAMYPFLEKGQLQDAYKIACLGVTDSDWTALGHAALDKLDLAVAKQAFIRLKDFCYLELIYQLEERQRRGEIDENLYKGDILAYQGQFDDAAKAYRQSGAETRAVSMFSDLRQFDQAKEAMTTAAPEEKKLLIAKQADWAKSTNEHKVAAEMYLDAGQFDKAIELMGEHGWTEMLVDVARRLDKADRISLQRCAYFLRQLGEYAFAAECYSKMGDVRSVVELHVEARQWEEAFALVKKHPDLRNSVYVPYAQWLAESDKFEEAQTAFHQAGMQAEAVRVLEQLTQNAVSENRFDDAGYYYWKLSMQCLDIARDDAGKRKDMLNKFRDFQRKADMYYVYFPIHRYTEEPFNSHMPEAYFNMARYLLHMTSRTTPPGISKVAILYTLAKHSRNLGAFKLARYAFEKLQGFRVPERFRDAVDLGSLTVRSKPFHDGEDILPMCYRCSTTNPLLNNSGNRCINCLEPFVYSFVSFEHLPVVEFVLEEGVTDEEAMECIAFDPAPKTGAAKQPDKWKESTNGQVQSLRLDQSDSGLADDDPFNSKLLNFDAGSESYSPVVIDRDTLKAIPSTEILVLKWPPPLRYQYFKSVMPDMSITKCDACNKLFVTDDFELQALPRGHCPFCRTRLED